ncbi:C-type lectin domain family 4 member D [Xyrauchen texanus]|uniref:C-type lectin domain family 4 member D n=1 Tax=Xyrauchen texanus TaxID=154827 RepID=UPI00224276D0|nr:C-type lectin domain family 4 member D [Xyrauchen texanus]
MQDNKPTDNVEGNPDRVDPFFQQGKVACIMFMVLLLLSFLVIGIVTGLNFTKNSHGDQSRGLLHIDGFTPGSQFKGPCLDGWLPYNNTCYLLVNEYGTWELSKSLCHNHGAHLMVVNSEEELDFISRVVQKSTDYWIGLKRDKMGMWTWVNGDDYHSTSHFWDKDQPVHGGVESCVHLRGTDTVRQNLWHDADCNSELYRICERKLEKGVL